jgi:PPOX class probable F420-dependent enzyme
MMAEARRLTRDEIDRFLATPVIARLATVLPGGAPYVAPVWQQWDGTDMWVIPRSKARFVENIRVEPRVCVSCADDTNPDHARVTIEGTAEIVEGPVALVGRTKEIADEMAVRYMGPEGPEYAAKTADRLRYLVRIKPERITSWSGGEWHPRYIVTKEG